ncbi:Uncharacterized protein dnm_013410 [Desulfonema magnum]|uniref:Uncharacterized protein n=1 Tax=Desulfonema magnum TaxID=45655 RepID=A0A975BH56_9BACT|nr:Uncharacterized protein dnm_013410 [Desulfonema magnum]
MSGVPNLQFGSRPVCGCRRYCQTVSLALRSDRHFLKNYR